MDFRGIIDFLGTPGGQALVGAGGAAASAAGSAASAGADRKLSKEQFAANLRQQDYWNRESQKTDRAKTVLAADPLGAAQKYAQKQALMAAILPNVRSANFTPGDPAIAAAMGSSTGGFANMLPKNGFDPAMIESMFGKNATMEALARRDKQLVNVDPNAPTTNLNTMYGDDATPYMNQIREWTTRMQTMDANERAAYQDQIKQFIAQEAKKGGFWSKLAKGLGIAGGIAATALTAGGASPLLAAAVGAGSGALGAAGSGRNPLMGAIMGGATPMLGKIPGMNRLPGLSLGGGTRLPIVDPVDTLGRTVMR